MCILDKISVKNLTIWNILQQR